MRQKWGIGECIKKSRKSNIKLYSWGKCYVDRALILPESLNLYPVVCKSHMGTSLFNLFGQYLYMSRASYYYLVLGAKAKR